jgi:hypothetical protein
MGLHHEQKHGKTYETWGFSMKMAIGDDEIIG